MPRYGDRNRRSVQVSSDRKCIWILLDLVHQDGPTLWPKSLKWNRTLGYNKGLSTERNLKKPIDGNHPNKQDSVMLRRLSFGLF